MVIKGFNELYIPYSRLALRRSESEAPNASVELNLKRIFWFSGMSVYPGPW